MEENKKEHWSHHSRLVFSKLIIKNSEFKSLIYLISINSMNFITTHGVRLLLWRTHRTPRYFEALLFRVEAPALVLICATVIVAEVGVGGTVVVLVTVTTGAEEVGAREGVEEAWVVVVPVLVLVAITSRG